MYTFRRTDFGGVGLEGGVVSVALSVVDVVCQNSVNQQCGRAREYHEATGCTAGAGSLRYTCGTRPASTTKSFVHAAVAHAPLKTLLVVVVAAAVGDQAAHFPSRCVRYTIIVSLSC